MRVDLDKTRLDERDELARLEASQSTLDHRSRRYGGVYRPEERSARLIGRRARKVLAYTAVVALVAVGLRFAWQQIGSTPFGGVVGAVKGAAKDLFTSEDILRSGPMITGALIREEYLPADGRGYTHRVSYTDRDSLASWTQSATFDAIVGTKVDTRNLPDDAVSLDWTNRSSLVYVVRLPEPQIQQPFWVSEPRDLRVDCNAVEAVWRFFTVNPSACTSDGVHADPHLRWKAEQDFRAESVADEELLDMGRRDVEDMVEGLATPFIDPLAKKYGFSYSFQFTWYTPAS